MKIYILSILVSIVAARPSNEILTPTLYTPIQSQYHSQDYLGQYAYGYNDGLSAKAETRYLDGTTQGGYSYYDANGQLQSVSYIADDKNGFRVAGTNLPKSVPLPAEAQLKVEKLVEPQPISETPEVIAARAQHFKLIEEVKNRNSQIELQDQLKKNEQEQQQKQLLINQQLPKPVEDTPEVMKAKEEHFAAKKEAELRNANLLKIELSQSPAAFAIPQTILAAKLLPSSSSHDVALLNHPSTIRTVQLPYGVPYGAAKYGWSYGYTNLAPFGFNTRYFYAV